MNTTQREKAVKFYAMHNNSGCFLMPNAWDVGSTKILVAAGFEAIGTTSAGIAFSSGRPDNVFCAEEARLGRREMFVQGTFSYAQDQIPQGELNGIFERHLLPHKVPIE